MKFSLAINMERMSPDECMNEISKHVTEMVQMADDGGFEIVWVAEHHAIEMTIAPGPFQLLAYFAAHTSKIRLGTAVAVAPYWHPIKLAGEAGLIDLLSNGRLELGIGKGAYQREFDRMSEGLPQNIGVPMMQEMLPVLKQLWKGDFEHKGEFWSFPLATVCPKPVQQPHPPIWVAARDPNSFNWAVENGCNVMTWPLTRSFDELESYMHRFESALEKNPKVKRPLFMTMRHTGIFCEQDESSIYIEAVKNQGKRFENLFRNLAPVINGFPQPVDESLLTNQDDYKSSNLLENLVFGSPKRAVSLLKRYEKLGVDNFCYLATYGLPIVEQKKSMKLFIEEVMPAFE